MEQTKEEIELERALRCLYVAVDKGIGDDITNKYKDLRKQLYTHSEVQAIAEAVKQKAVYFFNVSYGTAEDIKNIDVNQFIPKKG